LPKSNFSKFYKRIWRFIKFIKRKTWISWKIKSFNSNKRIIRTTNKIWRI